MSESNRLARRAEAGQGANVPTVGKASTKPLAAKEKPKTDAPKKDAPKDEDDLEVSRGGQVGELGG